MIRTPSSRSGRPSSEGDNPLRDEIFGVLNRSKPSAEEALKALSQCYSHVSNRMLVEKTARECDLRLSGFKSGKLELYYDIEHGRHDIGYISKGWDDPGFRIGDLVEVPRSKLPVLKERLLKLLNFCATQGVSLTLAETEDGVELQMHSVIYLEGFNKRVFEQVLHHLNMCVEKAKQLVGKE